MGLSILIARIMAVLYICTAISFLTKSVDYKKLFNEYMTNPAIIFLSGLITLILGFIMVTYHDIWSGPWWVVLITILGWAVLIKGMLFLTAPNMVKPFEKIGDSKIISWFPYLAILIGLIFGYYGFVA